MTWTGPVPRPAAHPAEGAIETKIEDAIATLEMVVDIDDVALLWTGGKEANVIADLLLYTVGDYPGVPDARFATIDTGNHFDDMYDFRTKYIAPTGDQGSDTIGPPFGVDGWLTVRHPIVDEVLANDDDPRGYHGAWADDVDLPETDPIDGLPRDPDEWTVATSCGAAKVGGLRLLIEDHGFDTLITGRRGDDPLVPGDGDLELVEDRRSPVPHRRINPLANWQEANVYAYIKKESVSLPSLYTEDGYRHTDAECCTDDDDRGGEYGEGGRDPDKLRAREALEDMGYV